MSFFEIPCVESEDPLRQIIAAFLLTALAIPASAGPISSGAATLARGAAQAAAKPPVAHRYLYPGIALVGGGTATALVGFLHKTSHPVDVSAINPLVANPFLEEQLLLSAASPRRNTALGIAGVGLAGVGAALLVVGRKHTAALQTVEFRPDGVSVTRSIRF